MAYTHTWNITKMDSWIDTGIVFNVHFSITTKDTDNMDFTMIQNMAVSVPYNPADATIPYAELTEETVIGWVQNELKIYERNEDGTFVLDADGNRIEVGDSVPEILASGERQLEDLIHPKVQELPLPWIQG